MVLKKKKRKSGIPLYRRHAHLLCDLLFKTNLQSCSFTAAKVDNNSSEYVNSKIHNL